MKIYRRDAKHAIDLIDGIVSHPFWQGIDRDALKRVMAALASKSIEIEEPLPDFAIPGDQLVFDCRGGLEGTQAAAKKYLVLGQVYEVSKIEIGRSSSEYHLKGVDVPYGFNSTLFSFAEPEKVRNESSEERERRDRLLCESHDKLYSYGYLGSNNLQEDNPT